jgi:hypothetical protein
VLGEDAVCADRGAAVDHFVEQLRDVLPFDLAETSPTPSRHDVLLQDALGLSPVASVSRGVQLDKVVDDGIDHVVFLRPRRSSCGRLFGCRVPTGGDIAERRCSTPPGLGNLDQWVRPDRKLLWLAARAVSQRPRFRAGGLNDQIQARHLPVGNLTARVGSSQSPNRHFGKHVPLPGPVRGITVSPAWPVTPRLSHFKPKVQTHRFSRFL